MGVGLAEALRAPEEVDVAQVAAVLGEVGVRGGVPPPPIRPDRLGSSGRAASHPARRRGPLGTEGEAVAGGAGSAPARRRVPVGTEGQLVVGRPGSAHDTPRVTRPGPARDERPRWTDPPRRPYDGNAPEVCQRCAPGQGNGARRLSPPFPRSYRPRGVLSLRSPRPEQSTI